VNDTSFEDFSTTKLAEVAKFIDGGREKRVQFIYSASTDRLAPNTTYGIFTLSINQLTIQTYVVYRVGSHLGWSGLFFFSTFPSFSSSFPVSVALYGDLGNANAQSLPRLQREAQSGEYDVILHVGDFAYDMHTVIDASYGFDGMVLKDNARVGDEFMRQIEPIAAYVPYMTIPGNHEEK